MLLGNHCHGKMIKQRCHRETTEKFVVKSGNMIMNDEKARMWKATVVVLFPSSHWKD